MSDSIILINAHYAGNGLTAVVAVEYKSPTGSNNIDVKIFKMKNVNHSILFEMKEMYIGATIELGGFYFNGKYVSIQKSENRPIIEWKNNNYKLDKNEDINLGNTYAIK